MTSAAFDPYHKWLGIPPHEQPPNLYRLLGISLFESDADVISYAADQRMTLLRSIATGPHRALSQRLLNEISAAKLTLLKSEKRQVYDAELRAKLEPQSVTQAAPTFATPTSPASARLRRAPQSRSRGPLMWVAFAAISCVTIGGLLFALNQQGKGPAQAKRNKETNKDEDSSAVTARSESVDFDASRSKQNKAPAPGATESARPIDVPIPDDADSVNEASDKKTKKGARLKKARSKRSSSAEAPSIPEPVVAQTPATSTLPDLREPPGAKSSATQANRAPIPPAEGLARAEKAIDDLMKVDFAKAKTNPLKAELARRFFELAKGTSDDAAAAYIQLRNAIDLAAESAQVELAFEVISALAERFDVDELAEKEKSLATAGRLAKNAQEFHQLTEIWVLLTREAIERDDYDVATRTASEARRCARLSADAVFVKIVESGTQNLQQLKEAYAEARPAKDRLAADPTDAEAAADWGRFLCAYKGDWNDGLPLWARTSDERTAALIKRDLAAPGEVDARATLGDDWFAAAEREAEELPRVTLKARAAHWYKQALPMLTGLTKARVEKRVGEIYEETSPFVRGQMVNVLGLVHPKRHAVRGEWGRRGSQLGLRQPISHGWFYVPVAIEGDFDLIVEFRRGKDSTDWTNIILPIGGGWVRLHVVLGEKPRVLFGNLPPAQNKAPAVSSRLVSGGRHRIEVAVRQVGDRAKVTAEINNRPVLVFDDVIRPHHGPWMIEGGAKAPSDVIGLETADATLIYESAMLRMVSGTAELLP